VACSFVCNNSFNTVITFKIRHQKHSIYSLILLSCFQWNQAPCHEGMCGSGVRRIEFFQLNTRWRWSALRFGWLYGAYQTTVVSKMQNTSKNKRDQQKLKWTTFTCFLYTNGNAIWLAS